MRRFGALVIGAALLSVPVGGAAVPVSAAAPAWSVVASPSPPSGASGELNAVACPSASTCFVAGDFRDSFDASDVPLVGRLDAGSTSIVPAARPPSSGVPDGQLLAVACPTSATCFAVGHYYDSITFPKTLIEQWNGTSWKLVASPNPAGATFSQLSGISCPTATSCFAVGFVTGSADPKTLVERWNGTSWSIVKHQEPRGANKLAGISCVKTTSCFAVGTTTVPTGSSFPSSVQLALLEQWNGTAWSVVPSPHLPTSTTTSGLAGISCASVSMCFAVGSFTNFVETETLLERWDGKRWAVAPSLFRSNQNGLGSISCPTTTMCLAAGAQIERWDGTTWSFVAGPSIFDSIDAVVCRTSRSCAGVGVGDETATYVATWNGKAWSDVSGGGSVARLKRLSCPDPATCLAVGEDDHLSPSGFVERWDGTTWRLLASPGGAGEFTSFSDLSCPTSARCFTVGSSFDRSDAHYRPLVEEWDGTHGSVVAIPEPTGATGSELGGVACPSATSCLAVGDATLPSGHETLFGQWNGTSWSITPSPDPPGVTSLTFSGLACVSTTDCFAVGSTIVDPHVRTSNTLVEHWDGTSWSVMTTPNRPVKFNQLVDVSCPTSTSCTAVGFSYDGAKKDTLVERWDGMTWSIVPSPDASGTTHTSLLGVSCASDTSCVAVGDDLPVGGRFYAAVLEKWDGTSWSLVPVPLPATALGSQLLGVSCGAGPCFAVGSYNGPRYSEWALVERYS